MSVVVIGLQQHAGPLSLLEAVAVSDADLARRSACRATAATSRRRSCSRPACARRCTPWWIVPRRRGGVSTTSCPSTGTSRWRSCRSPFRFDDDVTSHLFGDLGLESVVTGETEVVGQVAGAFERARRGASGPVRRCALPARAGDGKLVRIVTAISKGTTSFAYAGRDRRRGEDQAGCAAPRSWWSGPATWGPASAGALSDIAPGDALQRVVVVEPFRGAGLRPVHQARTGPFEMRAAPLNVWPVS